MILMFLNEDIGLSYVSFFFVRTGWEIKENAISVCDLSPQEYIAASK